MDTLAETAMRAGLQGRRSHIRVDERKDSTFALVADNGRAGQELFVGMESDVNDLHDQYLLNLDQMLHQERVTPIKKCYEDLGQAAAGVQDLVDYMTLNGKPRGHCFLCRDGF